MQAIMKIVNIADLRNNKGGCANILGIVRKKKAVSFGIIDTIGLKIADQSGTFQLQATMHGKELDNIITLGDILLITKVNIMDKMGIIQNSSLIIRFQNPIKPYPKECKCVNELRINHNRSIFRKEKLRFQFFFFLVLCFYTYSL